jgi:ABC-type spermidine/putrescine transport system permease subunit II
MDTDETAKGDEEMNQQIATIQKGIKYGLGVAFAGAVLCLLLMVPVAVMFRDRMEEASRGPGFTTLFAVSIVVPLAGIGILGVGLYLLVPLYMRYRHAKQAPEELFP